MPLYIGCHVGMSAPSFYEGSVKEALSYGATTFMFYTGAPQNSFRKPLSELRIEEGRKLLAEARINEDKIIVHAPYIINLGNALNNDLFSRSVELLTTELKRTSGFGAKILVLHPGAHVGSGLEAGLDSITRGLDEALSKDNTNVKIALETMAGKGSEIGSEFEDLAYIISHSQYKDRLGVCLDTCHMNDSGKNVFNVDELLEKVRIIIGIDRVLCVHINDSKNTMGSHKDRHANIGYGEIGFDTLNKFVHHPLLINVPKILETPYINEKPPYKKEIEMLKNSQYEENWVNSF